MEKAPTTIEESASNIAKTVRIALILKFIIYLLIYIYPSQIDEATRETTSGKFINAMESVEISW